MDKASRADALGARLESKRGFFPVPSKRLRISIEPVEEVVRRTLAGSVVRSGQPIKPAIHSRPAAIH